jgi:hypothetical protein
VNHYKSRGRNVCEPSNDVSSADRCNVRIAIQKRSKTMSANSVVKLNATGQQGQELFLVVDFNAKQAAVVIVDPRNGNIVVSDVQSIAQRGN